MGPRAPVGVDRALLAGVRKLPLADPGRLSDDHKAVLLVVSGHRRKGGVSTIRIGDILGLDASAYLDELERLQLIYAGPRGSSTFAGIELVEKTKNLEDSCHANT
jgi:hypothetical protein